MPDIVTPEQRSRMMSGIKGKNTKPELIIRKGLHLLGFRFRLHDRKLPGQPDLVFAKYHAVIFVHGCFWHAHDCHLFKWPASNEDFWREKIGGNIERDHRNITALKDMDWRVMVIWECALRGRTRRPLDEVIETVARWLKTESGSSEIAGYANGTDRSSGLDG